jgi:transposase
VSTTNRAVEEQERKGKRRTAEEKRRIVQESLEPGASVSGVAQRHGIHASQLSEWRKLYREGWLGEDRDSLRLVPVSVSGAPVSAAGRSGREASSWASGGTIRVELLQGHLRITGRPDVDTLRVLLERLLL